MAIEPINLTEEATVSLLESIGSLAHWLQAIGAVIAIYIIFQVISFITERKRLKKLDEISSRLEKIEKKLSKR